MIDLHIHALAGIDDGPSTLDDASALATAAFQAGTRTLVATPHISTRYPNDATTIAHARDELLARLAIDGVAIDVVKGAEIALTKLPDIPRQELGSLALGEGGWLLIECPFAPAIGGLDTLLLEFHKKGHDIVLAHPERCSSFQRDIGMLERLVDHGVLCSLTAGSLTGAFGERVKRFALKLAHSDLAHNVASDAHDPTTRGPSIADHIARAGLGELEAWLTLEVPAAIIAGDQIPARPDVAIVAPSPQPRKRLRWLRSS